MSPFLHGAKVYVAAMNLSAAETLAREINANGGCAEAGKVDALNHFAKQPGSYNLVDPDIQTTITLHC